MIELYKGLALTGFEQSLIYGFLALGVSIPFRFLNFSDLTSEGAFPLGGAITASLILAGFHPILAMTAGIFGASLLGCGTALLHLRFKVNTLLAGIILSTIAYSASLRIMGKPNLALLGDTCFTSLGNIFFTSLREGALEGKWEQDLVMAALMSLIIAVAYGFLRTEKGLAFQAVGYNPFVARKNGIKAHLYLLWGVAFGNGLSGLAGSLWVQVQQYSDINMGTGIVIMALASMMMGEVIVGSSTTLKRLTSPFIGALVYQQIQGLALALGLASTDLKMLSGLLLLALILGKKLGKKLDKASGKTLGKTL